MSEELRFVLTPPVLEILVDGTNVLWDPTTSEQVVLGKGNFVVEQDSAVEPSYVCDENDEEVCPSGCHICSTSRCMRIPMVISSF